MFSLAQYDVSKSCRAHSPPGELFAVFAVKRYPPALFFVPIYSVLHWLFLFPLCGCLILLRMNALLASGEVPGLYEGKELTALMAGCREAAQRDGVLIDSEDELFRRFTTKVPHQHLYLPYCCLFLVPRPTI